MSQTPTLFVPPGHYYSPVIDPPEAAAHLAALHARPMPDAVPGVVIDRAAMVQLWHELLPFLTTVPFGDDATPGLRYQFRNPSYARGDGSMLHAMLRRHRPKRVVEVGCGWTSACML